MEPKVGRVVLASIAVFCIAAALGAGSNLLYVASGSSLWFKGVLAGGVAVLGWYGLWARRCWKEKGSVVRRCLMGFLCVHVMEAAGETHGMRRKTLDDPPLDAAAAVKIHCLKVTAPVQP